MKRLAYLDHNVVDFLYKNSNSDLEDRLKRGFRTFFSEENLAEIERCGEKADDYAKALERLNPEYLALNADETKVALNEARIKPYPVTGCLRIRRKTVPRLNELRTSFFKSLLKSLGGLTGKSFEEVHSEQIILYRKIGQLTGESIEEANKRIADYERGVNLNGDRAAEILLTLENYDGVSTIRQVIGVTPQILNNVKGPNSVAQIWKIIEKSDHIKTNNISLERFFGLEQNTPNTKEPIPLYYKVAILYIMLNAIGYHQDDKFLKADRFVASVSDMHHVANGAFSEVFFSMDKNLCKKAVAIYEYFEIQTKVECLEERIEILLSK